MKDTLKKICNLQPQYSHKNTSEMKERGRLINTVLNRELSSLEPKISPSLGYYGKDYAVSSSDGQGNKVEAPWVRFCSEEMSPNAQNGYYVVIHFKKDGTGLYLTLGCGSSTLKNGSIVTLSKALLRSKTNVAKNALVAAHGSIEKFNDIIDLGGRTPSSNLLRTQLSLQNLFLKTRLMVPTLRRCFMILVAISRQFTKPFNQQEQTLQRPISLK